MLLDTLLQGSIARWPQGSNSINDRGRPIATPACIVTVMACIIGCSAAHPVSEFPVNPSHRRSHRRMAPFLCWGRPSKAGATELGDGAFVDLMCCGTLRVCENKRLLCRELSPFFYKAGEWSSHPCPPHSQEAGCWATKSRMKPDRFLGMRRVRLQAMQPIRTLPIPALCYLR
ncbi:hypothetical protein B0I37DRAFT_97695 [Chaetomium sp. MPI-CAGE-AT-0009]|nr:hypothetical protein B0I37DRAFT_97695 [Chaetomium sp. MPI-CAGE-AT-0009]